MADKVNEITKSNKSKRNKKPKGIVDTSSISLSNNNQNEVAIHIEIEKEDNSMNDISHKSQRGTNPKVINNRTVNTIINCPKESNKKNLNIEHVTTESEDLLAFNCSICLDENFNLAVGRCNHHICSRCAIRMRIKTKNFSCAICKEHLKFMIIFTITNTTSNSMNKKITDNNQHSKINHHSTSYCRSFQSFNINENDFDIDSYNLPGMRIDPIGSFLYIDCTKHYLEMENLRSIVCPMKQCQSARFHSNEALQKHLHDYHQGLMLCHLCLTNRPLFTCEHKVMTRKEFIQHLKGESFITKAKSNSQQEFIDDHITGHPKCEFCQEHFFDQSALYNHMQLTYFTCHLCPGQYMFRYYRNLSTLQQHYHEAHIVCGICASNPSVVESGVAIAFKDTREYAEHTQQYHRSSNTSNGPLTFRIGTTYHAQYNNNLKVNTSKNTQVNYVDLQMGTANPYSIDNPQQTNSSQSTNTRNNQSSLIPTHMRIAGRVTGAGRFAQIDQNDLLMQAMADEEAKAERKQNKKNQRKLELEQAFPSLNLSSSSNSLQNLPLNNSNNNDKTQIKNDPSIQSGIKGKDVPSIPTPHPLSIMNANRYNTSKEAQRRKEALAAEKLKQEKQLQEEKRIERNLILASALLGDNQTSSSFSSSFIPLNHSTAQQLKSNLKMSVVTASTVGATLRDQTYINNLISPLLSLGWNENLLMRTIYPATLTTWARQHAAEVLKIEKKLYSLMTENQLNSVQFKPMTYAMRLIVHQISRMYLLNSYEYDSEPQRYVSVVKQHDSYLPSYSLSKAAAALPIFTIPSSPSNSLLLSSTVASTSNNKISTEQSNHLYLSLNSEAFIIHMINTNSRSSLVVSSNTKVDNSLRIAFTCAEVVLRFKALLDNADIWREWYTCTLQSLIYIKPTLETEINIISPPGLMGLLSIPDKNDLIRTNELSKIVIPEISSLISSGANCIGISFKDHVTTQLAYHYLKFCSILNLVNTNGNMNTKDYPLELLNYIQNNIHPSIKQNPELSILTFFTINTSFLLDENIIINLLCEDIEHESASKFITSKLFHTANQNNIASINNYTKNMMNKSNITNEAMITNNLKSKHYSDTNEWHHQAFKTKLYQEPTIDSSMIVHSSALIGTTYDNDYNQPLNPVDDWEEIIDIDHTNNTMVTNKMDDKNSNYIINNEINDDIINEEWIQYLADKRKKSQNNLIPKYKPPNKSQPIIEINNVIINKKDPYTETIIDNINIKDYDIKNINQKEIIMLGNEQNDIDIIYEKDYFDTEYEFEQYLLKLNQAEENQTIVNSTKMEDNQKVVESEISNEEAIAIAYHPMITNNTYSTTTSNRIEPVYAIPIDDEDNHEQTTLKTTTNKFSNKFDMLEFENDEKEDDFI